MKGILESAVADGIFLKDSTKDRRVSNLTKPSKATWTLSSDQLTDIRQHIPGIDDPVARLTLALLAYKSMQREEVLGLTSE